MPKDFFTIQNCRSLHSLSLGDRIHVIGVCGVAMAQLALALAQRGYRVSGSDKEFYEPMGSLLKNSEITLYLGYQESNVPKDAALVIIGNAISYGNVEVDVVEKHNLPYSFFSKILYELVISQRHSIVVAGTHGKSTTTAMLAYLLQELKVDPSFFVGGAVIDLANSLQVGNGKFSVVEGDEYDSAFFAKLAKFHFYQAQTLVITSLEYDHADIYANLESINAEFDKLVLGLNNSAKIMCCNETDNLKNLYNKWKQKAKAELLSYGVEPSADYRLLKTSDLVSYQLIRAHHRNYGEFEFSLQIPGIYNAKNALAALACCLENGFELGKLLQAISGFRGVKRRQELIYAAGPILIEDFAHHPTAVRETILGIKARYPKTKLWAVFEPRSNTSRRKIFQTEYVDAFKPADYVVLCEVSQRGTDQNNELLDVGELSRQISKVGPSSDCLPNADSIKQLLLQRVAKQDVILVMSNGSFDGLVEKLRSGFSDQK